MTIYTSSDYLIGWTDVAVVTVANAFAVFAVDFVVVLVVLVVVGPSSFTSNIFDFIQQDAKALHKIRISLVALDPVSIRCEILIFAILIRNSWKVFTRS